MSNPPITENDVKLFAAIVGSELTNIDKLTVENSGNRVNRINVREMLKPSNIPNNRQIETELASKMMDQTPEFKQYANNSIPLEIRLSGNTDTNIPINQPREIKDTRQMELGLQFFDDMKKNPADSILNILTSIQNDINYLKESVKTIKLILDNPRKRKPYTRKPTQEQFIT